MKLSASEIAAITGGTLHGPDVTVDGATIDSRAVRGPQLFVPVVAERDGHDFIPAALAAGAAAYLSARAPDGGTAVAVDDTTAALTALGRAARDRLAERVVGVTGSVGKTSTKDLLAGILLRRWRTAWSPHSFNNELGVPLTLLNAPDGCEAAVVEMGARGIDHIASLCRIARPTVGVVTAVAAAHTELFGTLDDVARAKGELVEALPPDGVAVLNAADARVDAMASRTRARVLRFGPDADVQASAITLDEELRVTFRLHSPWGDTPVRLQVRGEHHVANALAAAAAAFGCGASIDDVAGGLAEAVPSPWRMELARTSTGAMVLNDAYNANPSSTSAALRALAQLQATRRIAVLGTMAELGHHHAGEHRAVAALARDLGIEVLAVAEPAYGATEVPDVPAALDALGELGPGDAVLVKGSRVAGLERLASALLTARPARPA